ncbi:hypothetical protein EV193_102159 [Herbihabitans rhizosphaerae]|uniref:Uncharacterized protein n=1 Tax=Herbihabitans rhizosphaerae TaxID=1872711 RepID=A0A4Q7L3Y8_9PSEU|nr:hypothetical protein [Herbihabitans rhizosphaerae]RZS43181.1 hypothetical protein EV193_102159 [Herbihabitans rhizosphaerae]
MRSWLVRGAILGVLHAVVETLRAYFVARDPSALPTVLPAVALAVLVAAAALWAGVDALLKHDMDFYRWFYAGLVAAPIAGILRVIGKATLVDQSDAGELGAALTSGAAFTALLVMVPAWLGMVVGQRLRPARRPARHAKATPKDA